MEEKQAAMIYFTKTGKQLAGKVQEKLEHSCPKIRVQIGKKPGQSLQEWCQESFTDAKLLIFIGAVGIAVRTIAPFVRDKFTDPAVLVLDEQGNYVIPILSGHVGGGNQWAYVLAKELSAVPVITTATDLYGKFAVDVFAAKQNLALSDRVLAKEISGAVLRGEQIGFYCERKVRGSLPKELVWEREKDFSERLEGYGIYVGIHDCRQKENTLCLFPKMVAIGIGCKKGTSAEEIERFIHRALKEQQIAMESVCCLASIDRKKDEPGILEFAGRYQIPFHTFSLEQLSGVPGVFTESEFVKDTMGIGNVCERAAILAAMEDSSNHGEKIDTNGSAADRDWPGAELILRKIAEHGITLALAEKEWGVTFE